jgi:hypothetical protein
MNEACGRLRMQADICRSADIEAALPRDVRHEVREHGADSNMNPAGGREMCHPVGMANTFFKRKRASMKLIHCADIHLDSRMTAYLPPEKAKERRQEILGTFLRMIDYAAEHDVHHVLIAGDLFDDGNITALTRNAVISAIGAHPDIFFYYLRGNHDAEGLQESADTAPANLRLFGDTWTSYALDG